jgi:hypothetical protein
MRVLLILALKAMAILLNFTVTGEGHPLYRYVFNMPINTGEFRYIVCRVKGTPNARWLLRLVSEDGGGKDFPYWWIPPEDWRIYSFDLSSECGGAFLNKTLREAYLSVKSINGKPATVLLDFYQIFKYRESPP